jgi:hypothetical protein
MTSREVLEDLARTVEQHLSPYGAPTHLHVLDLCAEAVAFGREVEPPETDMRARSAAHLLLELVCPFLDRRALSDLSVACGRAAVQLP